MVKAIRQTGGVTLVELMITVAILGILAGIGPSLIANVTKFQRLNTAHIETVRDARNSLSQINKFLRQAEATSVVISQETNQPPYSSIEFRTVEGRDVKYYQDGNNLNFVVNGGTKTLSDYVRYLTFTYPRTDDPTILSVSVTIERKTYEGRSKALQMAIEKVRIMN